MPEDVLINFVGDTSRLVPVENALDSIIEKDAKVGAEWKKTSEQMSNSSKISTGETNKLAKSIDQLAAATKNMDKSVIAGAYKDYLKQIQSQLQLTQKELIAYIQNAKKATQEKIITDATDQEVKELTLSIEVMNDQLKQMGVIEDGTGEKTKSLRARIREAKEELVAMAEAGLQGTPAFTALQQKAGQLDDEMRDLNTTVKGLGSDTKHIDGLISLASGVAGGFALSQGAAALFGNENEELQKALLKVNAAMSILQGLQAIQNVLQKESAASLLFQTSATKANSAALKEKAVSEAIATATAAGLTEAEIAQAGATAAATVATESLNVALLSNPVTAVLVGVLALVTAINALNSANHFTEQIQLDVNRTLQDATTFLDIQTKAIEHQTSIAIANAKLRGASDLELAAISGNASKKEIENIKEQSDALSKKYNEEIDLFNKVYDLGGEIDKETLEAHAKLLDEKIKLDNEYQEKSAALLVKGSEFEKQKQDEALKSFIAFQQARVAGTIAGSDNERSVQISSIREIAKEREASADFIKLSDGEKALARANDEKQIQGLQLQNYQHYLKGRTSLYDSYVANAKLAVIKNETDTIESLNKVTDLEIAALKKRKEEALRSDPNLNGGEAKKIVAETNLQISELEKQKQARLFDIQKSGVNAQLILSAKGSQEEYDNKFKLINIEQNIELSATELTKEKIVEINAKFDKQREDAWRVFNEAQIQNQINYANAELDAFGITETEKLAIVLKRLQEQRELEISQADFNAAKIAEINAKYDSQSREAKKNAIQVILQDNLKTFDVFNELAKVADERILSQEKYTLGQRITASNDLLVNELFRLDLQAAAEKDMLDKGLITQKEYDIIVQDINNKRAAAALSNEERITAATLREIQKRTSAIQAVLSISQKSLIETLGTNGFTTAITELQNLGNQVQDVFAKVKAGTLTMKEAGKAIAETAAASIQNIINQAFADSSAARQAALNDAIIALEDEKAKELDNKNITEQQKADIDKKYQDKERQLKTRAWEADKEAKKEQAVINGALAVALAFATNPFPYSLIVAGIVAASTLAQVAIINKAKPPKFGKGKEKGTYEGLGYVDDAGRIEPILRADGTIEISKGTPKERITYLGKDDIVFPSMDHMYKHFSFPQVPEYVQTNTTNGQQIDYDKLSDAIAAKMKGVIPSPQSTHVNINEKGIQTIVKDGTSTTEYRNKRYSIKP